MTILTGQYIVHPGKGFIIPSHCVSCLDLTLGVMGSCEKVVWDVCMMQEPKKEEKSRCCGIFIMDMLKRLISRRDHRSPVLLHEAPVFCVQHLYFTSHEIHFILTQALLSSPCDWRYYVANIGPYLRIARGWRPRRLTAIYLLVLIR